MKKVLIYTVITAAVLGFCGVTAINAQAEERNGIYPSIVQKLVERFNLNLEDVQQVFDEAREERHQKMQFPLRERLGEALTEEQKEALSAKREEMREGFEALKDLSLEERQAKMQELGLDLRGMQKGFGRGYGDKFFGSQQ